MKGEDEGGPGWAVSVSVGGAHVSSPGRWEVGEARVLHPGSFRVQLLTASFALGSAGQDRLPPRRTYPRRLSYPPEGDSHQQQQ